MDLRRCLREPIPEIEIAAQRVSDAVSAHLRGERDVAERLLRLANDQVVRDWLNSVWGKKSAYNQPRRILVVPSTLPKKQRSKPRDPTAEMKQSVHRRDGHYCRFCKMPVIRAKIRLAIREKYPKAVPWEGTNATQHAAFQCMWAQYDHILPNARGGRTDLENIYLTCAACNYGKFNFLLEELDLIHPSLHQPRQGNWDGLERFH
jgi:5-methylcytosine-specific restriction endonuclease McrA